ncbi:MAG: hypothetical protein D6806_08795 [Deltaproteobacteria bacterium]|nr:MAG: hypothetical protein D6806_08795 [Deltaproteobacteria bacterium]
MVAIIVGLLLFAPGLAGAQEEGGSEGGVIYQKKTVYNFEDDTITGDLTRPDEEFLTGRKLAHHKSLIRVRENFREKVLQSAKDL